MKKIIALSTLLALGALGMACGGDAANNTVSNANKNVNAALTNANAAMANAANQMQSAANQVSNAASQVNSAASNMANKPAMNTAPVVNSNAAHSNTNK
jgi:hypothetical protein